MTDTQFLTTEEGKISRKRALKRRRVLGNAVTYAFAGVAVCCFIGLLVAVIMLNFNQDEATLFYILTGAFAGGSALFAACSFAAAQAARKAYLHELDFKERCCGENCFYVGEGTIAQFGETELVIRAEEGGKSPVRVPYAEMRFFSLCNRSRPKNKGNWSVALEIPARYLAKKGKGDPKDPPALVEADGKQRLYDTLQERSLTLLGETPKETDGKKFTLLKRFKLPNLQKRKRALMFSGLGAVLTVLGIVLPLTLDSAPLAVLAAVGLVVLGRALISLSQAHATLAFYEEGVYFAESGNVKSTFLTWEEIETVSEEEKNSIPVLHVKCVYGSYYFPSVADAYAWAKERFAEKCGGKNV